MQKISFLDGGFFMLEARNAPMHVSGLLVFKLPDDHDENFFHEMIERLHTGHKVAPPFNLVLRHPYRRFGQNEWVVDKKFDLDYHLRHIALPRPGTAEQLRTFIARIHGTMLDRARPLWEYYMIEGVTDDRFAICFKVHHSLFDGNAGMQLMLSCLSEDPEDTALRPFWQGSAHRWQKKYATPSLWEKLENIPVQVAGQTQGLSQLVRYNGKLAVLSNLLQEDAVPWPSIAPKTRFNKKISAQRRFSVEILPLKPFLRIGKLTDSTLNDVVLTVCSGAVRRYLEDHSDLPEPSLIGQIPVALAEQDGSFSANRIITINCNLGTDIESPIERLTKIKTSMSKNKEMLTPLSGVAKDHTGTVNGLRMLLTHLLEGYERVPLSFNLAISNVPGPRKPLYLNGARLEYIIPSSIIFNGHGLNITVVSCAGNLCFGLIACRDLLPDLDRLAQYIGDAFEELETFISAKGLATIESMAAKQKTD